MQDLSVGILHAGNTYNYGSMMMAENFIAYLHRQLKNINFYVDDEFDTDLLRLRQATNIPSIYSYSEMGYHRFKPDAHDRLLRQYHWLKDLRKLTTTLKDNGFRRLFILGGDSISEAYASSYGLLKMYYELRQMSRVTNVVLVGHTIGPFHSWRRRPFADILSKMTILTRDPLNYAYLKEELGLTDVYQYSDLAFLDLTRQSELPGDLLNHYSLSPDRYIVLVPSGSWHRYHPDRNAYVAAWVHTIQTLLNDSNLAEYDLVMLAHVLKPPITDDREIMEEIARQIQDRRLVSISSELLPFEARHILGNGHLTITGRMHAAISTFQMGRPAISLSYSVKYAGIIGQALGLENLIIDAATPDLYQEGRMSEAIQERINLILDHYDGISRRIEEGVKREKNTAALQVDHVVRLIHEDLQ